MLVSWEHTQLQGLVLRKTPQRVRELEVAQEDIPSKLCRKRQSVPSPSRGPYNRSSLGSNEMR
jgi:hypothetical protein